PRLRRDGERSPSMATAVPVDDARAVRSPHSLLGRSPLLRSPRTILRLGVLLLALGLVCRAVRYLLQFPFWGDEGYVLVNFLDRDYLGLTKMLDGCQVAPIPFLWGEATAYRLLGSTE